MANQIVTVSFFKYTSLRKKWWAFTQMQFARGPMSTVSGLQFCRMMGSGAGNGFSIKPDWSVYSLFCVWDSEQDAQAFFSTHRQYAAFQRQSAHQWTLWLEPMMAHGKWNGQTIFAEGAPPKLTDSVVVLTRATIRPTKLADFWKHVPSVSRAMEGREGLLFSKGVGEWPIFMQATISLWASRRDMVAYAYQGHTHADIIKRTRERNWYSEELFAEFRALKYTGNWPGLEIPAHLFGSLPVQV